MLQADTDRRAAVSATETVVCSDGKQKLLE
jgi:hypothetical protein